MSSMEDIKHKYIVANQYLPRLLSRAEAAHRVGVGVSTFDKMVQANLMPKPKAIYTRRVWDILELDRAVDELPVADFPVQAVQVNDPYTDVGA